MAIFSWFFLKKNNRKQCLIISRRNRQQSRWKLVRYLVSCRGRGAPILSLRCGALGSYSEFFLLSSFLVQYEIYYVFYAFLGTHSCGAEILDFLFFMKSATQHCFDVMYEQCIGFCAKRALGRHRSCSYCRERAESSHSKGFLKGKLQEKYVAACSRMQPHAAACSSMQQHEKYPRDSTWCFLSRVYWGRSDQSSSYHLHIILISSSFHLHFIVISSSFHPHFIFISSSFHTIWCCTEC